MEIWGLERFYIVWMLFLTLAFFVHMKIIRRKAQNLKKKDIEKNPSNQYLSYRIKVDKFLNESGEQNEGFKSFDKLLMTTRRMISAQVDGLDCRAAGILLYQMLERL